MKISKWILVIWLAASASAQAPPAKPQADSKAAAKPSGGQAVAPSPKAPTPAIGAKKKTAAAPKTAAGKPAGQAAMRLAPSPAGVKGGKQEAGQPPSAHGTPAPAQASARKGERDPFVSPIVREMRAGENCVGSGRQCLFVGDISLHGVVQSSSGYIAVVMNGDHTYFLREKDPLADGDVERITKNAIIMHQRSSDVLGRLQVREVTKKLGTPAV